MPTGELSYSIGGWELPTLTTADLTESESVEAPEEDQVVEYAEPVQSNTYTAHATADTATTVSSVTIDPGSITLGNTTYTHYPNSYTTIWAGDTNVGSIPNQSAYTYTIQAPQLDYSPFVQQSELEKFFKRLYKLISDHTTIDVTEEEFLNLLKEDDKDGADD